MKKLTILLLLGGFVACDKTPLSPPEPTYRGRPMSEWARRAIDRDEDTRENALFALSEFEIGSGTHETSRALNKIILGEGGHYSESEKGAAVALASWLCSRETKPEDVSSLFAVIEKHDSNMDWLHICSLASLRSV